MKEDANINMSIRLQTDLAGKIKNLPNFKNEALLPVFEAVTNSIQAIQERGISTNEGEISVVIEREQTLTTETDEFRGAAITGFSISDNGIGFNTINFEAFNTSDTSHKLALGGKGVGRFLWLKAFERVKIESIFEADGGRQERDFSFTPTQGIEQANPVPVENDLKTTVHLWGFKKDYRDQPSAFKTTEKIAQRILEHCLSYFIAGQAPRINVQDNSEVILLNDKFEKDIKPNITKEEQKRGGQNFSLSHIKLYSTRDAMHNLVLCADSREVKRISLAKILGAGEKFDETEGRSFTYALYVSSPYLDSKVNSSRTDFDILGELLDGPEIGTSENLERILSQAARDFLKTYLEAARKQTEQTVTQYISENPALRCIPHYCPEVFDVLQPNSTPEKINEVLYLHKGKAEFAMREKSEKLLKTQSSSFAELESECKKIVVELESFQKDELAAYICKRKLIINILEKQLESNANGRFSKEDVIHDIVFPRKTTSEEINFDAHNLWLIDENLVFHAFAASDKPLKQITSSNSIDRPDIIAFAEIDEDKIARAVSIIEFKKPQREGYPESPIDQTLRYLRKIKGETVRLPNGRNLMVNESTRFYCYVLCDITDKIKEFAENGNFTPLKGKLGFYSYNGQLRAHIEILAFDKIVSDAKRRHKAFFDKLGIS
jgi:hypothetical protein